MYINKTFSINLALYNWRIEDNFILLTDVAIEMKTAYVCYDAAKRMYLVISSPVCDIQFSHGLSTLSDIFGATAVLT